MIGPLLRDALRLLLPIRTVGLLALVGLLTGGFVRATRAAGGTGQLSGVDLRGASLETLLGTLFTLTVGFALIAGLLLAAEDRSSGFCTQVAVRPVRRLTYALGRLFGLGAAVAIALALFTAVATPSSGLRGRDMPALRERILPQRVTVDGRALGTGEATTLGEGSVARYEFAAGASPRSLLALRGVRAVLTGDGHEHEHEHEHGNDEAHPDEGGFDGTIDLAFSLIEDSGHRESWDPPPVRALAPLPITAFGDEARGGFALEVRNQSRFSRLEVGGDELAAFGGDASLSLELLLAALLVLLGGCVVGSIAFFLGTGLSQGPAALAGTFVLLIGLGRGPLLDIIGTIGVGPARGEADGFHPSRVFLELIVRAIPDLGAFNAAETLGRGEALARADLGYAFALCAIAVATLAALTALCAPLRER